MLRKTLEQIQENLQGAPTKLLVICICQLALLILGTTIGVGKQACQIIDDPSTNEAQVDCSSCSANMALDWREALLLTGGIFVILTGVMASLRRSKKLCQFYGFVMMIYAFLIGLTSILTAIEIPVIRGAANRVQDSAEYPRCQEYAEQMVTDATNHSILFAVNCILDCLGAWFAIQSKRLFDYQDIQIRLDNDEQQIEDQL